MNKNNPVDSYILLEKVGKDTGKVLNTSSLPTVSAENIRVFLSPHYVNNDMVTEFSSCLNKALIITRQWLKITGNEFVLDPEYYYIS